jgi:predicted O-methyltransferase YrrM
LASTSLSATGYHRFTQGNRKGEPTLGTEFRAQDWDQYRMAYSDPFRRLEPDEDEAGVVDRALNKLHDAGVLAHTQYEEPKFQAFRRAVRENFEIPWTAISPRMQRFIYAVNAIHQPRVMVAAGIFCGNTFISNAGAAVGPGASYKASELVGLEIKEDEAARAERNVRKIDPSGVARIVADDAVPWSRSHTGPIDLLYLDADGDNNRGKGIYLEILQAAWDHLPKGAIILAHNSVNCAKKLASYFSYVRDPENCQTSINVILDPEGLEVSMK